MQSTVYGKMQRKGSVFLTVEVELLDDFTSSHKSQRMEERIARRLSEKMKLKL